MKQQCPQCRDGLTLNPSTHVIGTCTMCGGRGTVDGERLCRCGRYARALKDGIRFCGRKECLTKAKEPPPWWEDIPAEFRRGPVEEHHSRMFSQEYQQAILEGYVS